MQTQELYQLAMFLQEAMMREEALNKKLRTIQTFIDQAKENSENGWLVKKKLSKTKFCFVVYFKSFKNSKYFFRHWSKKTGYYLESTTSKNKT